MFTHTLNYGSQIHIGGRSRPTDEQVAKVVQLDDSRLGLNFSRWPALKSNTSYSNVASVVPVLDDILGNDTLGDCTEACSYHLQALREANAGRTVFHPTRAQVVATYSRDG